MGGSATNTRAMRSIGQLCQDAGLRVVEASGWTDRGRTWSTLRPAYVVCHHTAATVDVDRILIDGRSDVPGPLCNFALHKDGTVVLIASGLANHAGVATISSDQAYGIEATGPIPITEFGPSAFPNHNAYITLVAAIRLHHGWSNQQVTSHKEIARPLGRKIDPSFDMDAFRTAVERRVRNWGVPEEEEPDDMTAEETRQLKAIYDALIVPGTTSPEQTMNLLFSRVRSIEAGTTDYQKALGARLDALENLLTESPEPPA